MKVYPNFEFTWEEMKGHLTFFKVEELEIVAQDAYVEKIDETTHRVVFLPHNPPYLRRVVANNKPISFVY